MADTVKMVNVKLAARCLVNGQIREAGEIVDLPEFGTDADGKQAPFAVSFGEVVKPGPVPKTDEKKPE